MSKLSTFNTLARRSAAKTAQLSTSLSGSDQLGNAVNQLRSLLYAILDRAFKGDL
ncbi:MAG: hypothetical protein ACLQU4_01180 [Limisphaerales bacterium]